MNPTGHVGQAVVAPAGYVLGRNSCIRCWPCAPKYVADTVIETGRSRCADTCQFWTEPTLRSGSMANVAGAVAAPVGKPSRSVNGESAVLSIESARECGGC